jgi:hypothetical protein
MKSPLRDSFAAIICLVATGSTGFGSDEFAVREGRLGHA